MSDQITYNYGGLETLVHEINANRGTLTSTNQDLLGFVQGLVASWESDAQVSYKVVQDRWLSAQDELLQTLSAIQTAVGQAHSDMAHTDKTNANSWH